MLDNSNNRTYRVDPKAVYWVRVPLTGLMFPVFYTQRRRWSAARKRRFTRTMSTVGLLAFAWVLMSLGLAEWRS